jgi:hypothetical protein
MSSLVIIGNGFDLYHGFKTSYKDFKDYLTSNFSVDESDALIPSAYYGDYDENEVVSYIVQVLNNVLGDNWGDLETALGYSLYDELSFDLRDINIDDKDSKIDEDYNLNSQLSSDLNFTFSEMKRLFYKWVHEELTKIPTCLKGSPDIYNGLKKIKDAYFLSFNYTYTLEKLYGIQDVLHIHGTVDSLDEEIRFGHNDTTEVTEQLKNVWGVEELDSLKRYLYKDTDNAIENHKVFFAQLDSVTDIFSFGFSFSEPDQHYLDEIDRHAKNITWHLNQYDYEKYKKTIEKRGYRVGEAIW